jgi:hypothetical protein
VALGALFDADGDGAPDLNDALLVRFVDAQGRILPARTDQRPWTLGDREVAGYRLMFAPFSSSRSDHQLPTIRTFAVGAFQTVIGIGVDDAVTNDLGGNSSADTLQSSPRVSFTGARQIGFPALGESTQRVAQWELDVLEWYLLNVPPPAQWERTAEVIEGEHLMRQWRCPSCHVPDWDLIARNDQLAIPGDRRAFHLGVRFDAARRRFVGDLVDLAPPDGKGAHVPRRLGFRVEGIYTDLVHHDLGPRFWEWLIADGRLVVLKRFRTAPLWGVGSTAPYGHDGRSLSLDDVIRRHGGEAEASTAAYVEAAPLERRALLEFLHSLRTFDLASVGVDLDRDG